MMRLFLLLLALGIGAALLLLGLNVRDTTRYFQENGREASLVIGKRYNTEWWARPVPLKKIYTYEARMEPSYEVLVETDQELKPRDVVSVRFLTRDLAPKLRAFSWRPVANSLRLRDADDKSPVKLAEADLFDKLVDKAMGPPEPGVYTRPRATAEAAPDRSKSTVPFLVAKPGDTTWTLVWANSRIGEWVALALLALTVPSLLSSAWERHLAARNATPKRVDLVHPSLRQIEADAPAAPQKRIAYVPKAAPDIALTEAEKHPAAERADTPPAPNPAAAPAPTATVGEENPPRPAPETATPTPATQKEPVLKLRRSKPDSAAS